MGNKKESKKFRRKIKIRLADPNDPSSYICEIFDDDVDDFITKEAKLHPENNVRADTSSTSSNEYKQKSYFEILMSNDCRKTIKLNESKENFGISTRTKLCKSDCCDGERKIHKKSVRGSPKHLEKVQLNGNWESTSSDDETIFQVQGNKKLSALSKPKDFVSSLKENEAMYESKTIFSPSSQFLAKEKPLNILNYFTKANATEVKNLRKNGRGGQLLVASTKADPLKKSDKIQKTSSVKSVASVNKENVKLAPLFLMKEKKQIDSAAQRARYEFLHREMKGSKSGECNKNHNELGTSIQPTCHVQQRDGSIYWSVRDVCPPVSDLDPAGDFKTDKTFRTDILNDKKVKSHRNFVEIRNTATSITNSKAIDKLKSRYVNLNFNTLIEGLKGKKDKYLKVTNDLDRSPANCDSGLEIFNSLWTEKYRPSSCDVLGNENVVKQFRNWLVSWKAFDEELKSLASSSRKAKENACEEDDDDEDDDWFVGTGDENFGPKPPTSVCLLSGPNACGKTSLVFAVADELEFNVLEVNASSKRSGKKVLTDFQEATQSHKVHRTCSLQPTSSTKQKTITKKEGKAKIKQSQRPTKKVLDEVNDSKISLLLIEDADIVFEEHDEGFYSAITSLVQTSKRPFVFVTNDSKCSYLDAFRTDECLSLEMRRPPFNQCCAVLDVISVLEDVQVEKEAVGVLIRQNHFDLRKSLLELQFWHGLEWKMLKSGHTFDLGQFWWGLSNFLYPKTTFRHDKSLQFKRKRRKDSVHRSDDEEIVAKKFKVSTEDAHRLSFPVSDGSAPDVDAVIHSFSNMLDTASILDLMGSSNTDEPIPEMNYTAKDSHSLDENLESVYYADRNLREDICNELMSLSARAFAEKCRREHRNEQKISLSYPSWEEIRWRRSQEEARKEVSVLVPTFNGRDSRGMHTDYLPLIRSICRMERNRATANNKRKNRFNHYLNSVDVQLTERTVDICCQVFGS